VFKGSDINCYVYGKMQQLRGNRLQAAHDGVVHWNVLDAAGDYATAVLFDTDFNRARANWNRGTTNLQQIPRAIRWVTWGYDYSSENRQ
jgi:hypothetical protein